MFVLNIKDNPINSQASIGFLFIISSMLVPLDVFLNELLFDNVSKTLGVIKDFICMSSYIIRHFYHPPALRSYEYKGFRLLV